MVGKQALSGMEQVIVAPLVGMEQVIVAPLVGKQALSGMEQVIVAPCFVSNSALAWCEHILLLLQSCSHVSTPSHTR